MVMFFVSNLIWFYYQCFILALIVWKLFQKAFQEVTVKDVLKPFLNIIYLKMLTINYFEYIVEYGFSNVANLFKNYLHI